MDERPLTIEEYIRLPEEDMYVDELVRGRVVREPRPGYGHGRIALNIGAPLKFFVEGRQLGVVFMESGVVVERDPDTVRGPDVSFVRAERIPAEGVKTTFFEGAPDLAVEVLSPSNTKREMAEKMGEYFRSGARAVWTVDPRKRVVMVHESGTEPQIVHEDGELDGGDILPGFRLALADVFET